MFAHNNCHIFQIGVPITYTSGLLTYATKITSHMHKFMENHLKLTNFMRLSRFKSYALEQKMACHHTCSHEALNTVALIRGYTYYRGFISLIVSCTSITVAPSSLNIISVCRSIYSNLLKFQNDNTYVIRYDILSIMDFPYMLYARDPSHRRIYG